MPEVGRSSSSTSGAAWKRQRDGLPRAFLIYELDECCVSGAFLAEDCFLESSDCIDVFWRLSRIVSLKEPHCLPHRLKLRCGISALDKDLEVQIRFSEAAVGGTLNSLFPDLSAGQWLAWAFSHAQVNQLVRNAAYYKTTLSVANRLNISPTRG